jgi:hypothetical protein
LITTCLLSEIRFQGSMEDEDSQALLNEAREWLGDNVDDMSGNPMDQLPQPKTRRIHLDPSKR